MRSFKQLLVEVLASLGGIGSASIGGLPGIPRSREEEQTIWVDWGGSHLNFPEIQQSQQAFKQGAYDRAYEFLRRAQKSIKVETSTFRAQLFNNLAVSAYNLSERVDDMTTRQRLLNKAQDDITRAASITTSSLELSDAVRHNLAIIGRKRQHRE